MNLRAIEQRIAKLEARPVPPAEDSLVPVEWDTLGRCIAVTWAALRAQHGADWTIERVAALPHGDSRRDDPFFAQLLPLSRTLKMWERMPDAVCPDGTLEGICAEFGIDVRTRGTVEQQRAVGPVFVARLFAWVRGCADGDVRPLDLPLPAATFEDYSRWPSPGDAPHVGPIPWTLETTESIHTVLCRLAALHQPIGD